MKISASVGSVGRLKAAISEIKNSMMNQQVMESLSNGLKDRIIERAYLGVDAAGEGFAPYTAQYARRRERQGLRADIVTLRNTGSMLDSITAAVYPEAGVSFNSAQEAQKMVYLQQTGVGKARIKRRFFNVNDTDTAWARELMSGHADKAIKAAFANGGEG